MAEENRTLWPTQDAEIKRTQLYASIQAAQSPPTLGSSSGANDAPSVYDFKRFPPDTGLGGGNLTRTRSAVRGPITDRRGLGTLTPYVLPGLLRRNSMALSSQMSALQMFPSQHFPDSMLGQDGEVRPSTSPMTQRQELSPGEQVAAANPLVELLFILQCTV